MQIDPGQLHPHQHARQHQWHTDGNHQSRPPAQAHEADQQHDDQGCQERFLEFADAVVHGVWLIVCQGEFDSQRQAGLDFAHPRGNFLAHFQNIAPLYHGDHQAKRRLAV